MKVFISWSGDLSLKVALALRDWLPSVIQSLEPYVSSEDIDKGARWSTDIAKELEDSSYGILCVTKENLEAPWLNFEAGALSKSIERSRVSPFLFGVKRSEIKGPVLQFQSTVFERDDVMKLISGLNAANEPNLLEDARLEQIFDVWWPQLEKTLNKIEMPEPAEHKEGDEIIRVSPSGAQSEILEEVLELVRQQQRVLNSPEELLPETYLQHVFRRTYAIRADHPAYEALERGWSRIDAILSSFEEEDTIPKSVVFELLGEVRKPVEYILHQSGRKSRRLRRPSSGDDE